MITEDVKLPTARLAIASVCNEIQRKPESALQQRAEAF